MQEDFTEKGELYDLILDLAAYHPISHYVRALRDDGIYLMVGGKTSAILKTVFGAMTKTKGTDKQIGILMWKQYVKEDFDFLIELLSEKKIVPVIDRRYKLSETKDAFKYLMDGHAKGKIIINII